MFTCRSVIHFQLIFVKGIESMSRWIFFFFWCVDVQLFQYNLLKDYQFSSVLLLLLRHRSVDHTCLGLFLGSLFYFIDILVYSFTNIILSGLLQLYSKS